MLSAVASLANLSAASFDTASMDKQAAAQAAAPAVMPTAPKASEVLKPNGAVPEVSDDLLAQLAGKMALMAEQLAALKAK